MRSKLLSQANFHNNRQSVYLFRYTLFFLRIQKRLRTNPQPPCVQENESLCFFECFLRANSVLSHINYYGYYDNQTLDYLCQVIVNTQKNEAVVDDAEDQAVSYTHLTLPTILLV